MYHLEGSAKNKEKPYVGQRSEATPDQTKEEDSLQVGKRDTSCGPWIVVNLWYQFVFHIATAGLIKYIFTSSNRAKLARLTKNPKQKVKRDNNRASEDRLRDFPGWLEEFSVNHREPGVPAPAHITHGSETERPTKVAPRKHSEKSLRKFLEPTEKAESHLHCQFGNSFEYLSWNHRTCTLFRSETKGIADGAVRRIKEGTSAVL